MSLDHWLAFVAASAILLAIPGPTVLLVISYALGHGRKPAAAIVAGVALGDLTAMTASMQGLGAILATSAAIFTLLRWIGGAYLVYLGIKLWRAPIQPEEIDDVPSANPLRMFCHSYAVTALNPKSIIFLLLLSCSFWTQPARSRLRS
jgi:threonine/homoserine/homoserine lactone efflux protein